MAEEKTLFELLGGRPTLERVHKIFYDKLFAHPWLGQFFIGKDQLRQENQQTDFMTQPMGGKAIYSGKFPVHAHANMYITDEMFTLRSQILGESLREAGVPEELAKRWLETDNAFRGGIVKKSIADCKGRYHGEEFVIVRDPQKKVA
mgnify:CR=1 FL=1